MIKDDEYDRLSEYIALENSEYGEYVTSLLCMRDHATSHGMSEKFDIELDIELRKVLGEFNQYCTIIEVTEIPEPRTHKELVWKDD